MPTYIRQLDGLRFVAICLVMLTHFVPPIERNWDTGYVGVDLFFVLSGFLITSILLQQKDSFFQAWKTFMGRRVLRIFPLYFLVVGLLWFIDFPQVRTAIGYLLTYTFNYGILLEGFPRSPITHLWSLSLEEQFYLLWPFLILAFRTKVKLLQYFILIIVLISGSQLLFNWMHWHHAYDYYGLFPRIYSLALGSWGACYYLGKSKETLSVQLPNMEWTAIAVLLACIYMQHEWKSAVLIYPIISLYLILRLSIPENKSRLSEFMAHPSIAYIGKISYGIYLMHLPIAYLLKIYVVRPLWSKLYNPELEWMNYLNLYLWIITAPFYILASILIAHFVYRKFEHPILRWKDEVFRYR